MKYTINGNEFIVDGNYLYSIKDEKHSVEDLEKGKNTPYLYEFFGEGRVCTIIDRGENFYCIEIIQVHGDKETTVTKDELKGVTPVEIKAPDSVYKCPECGSLAGEKETNPGPRCLKCGYGYS